MAFKVIKSSKGPLPDPQTDKKLRAMIVEATKKGAPLLFNVVRAMVDNNLTASQVERILRDGGIKNPDAWRIVAEEIQAGNK